MPWLSREEHPKVMHWVQSRGTQSHVGSTPTQPTPHSTIISKCPHCKVPNAPHASVHCPQLNHCYYCKSITPHPFDCPVPHTHGCHSRLSCIVPYHHKNNCKMHCPYVLKDQCNIDWEATSIQSN